MISYFIMQILKRRTWGPLTEYRTWFLYRIMSFTICLIQSSYTQNLPLVCCTSRHFIDLMTALLCFCTMQEKEREREHVCLRIWGQESAITHPTPDVLKPKISKSQFYCVESYLRWCKDKPSLAPCRNCASSESNRSNNGDETQDSWPDTTQKFNQLETILHRIYTNVFSFEWDCVLTEAFII